MDLIPRIAFVLGVVAAAAYGQQQQVDPIFTKTGKRCVEYDGIPAKCGKHGQDFVWCYYSARARYWEECIELNRQRCSSVDVTRHYDCDPTSDDYCCSDKGWCGSTDAHCKCDDCKNLRDEACNDHDCDANSKCYWNEIQKETSCKCSNTNFHQDYLGQCHQCLLNNHCPDDQHCKDNRCADPCLNYCNTTSFAICSVANHQHLCTCPEGYQLVGYTACEQFQGPSTFIIIGAVSAILLIAAMIATIVFCMKKRKHNGNMPGKQTSENYLEPIQNPPEGGTVRPGSSHEYENPDDYVDQLGNMAGQGGMVRQGSSHYYEEPDAYGEQLG